jgi:hypothetical protein
MQLLIRQAFPAFSTRPTFVSSELCVPEEWIRSLSYNPFTPVLTAFLLVGDYWMNVITSLVIMTPSSLPARLKKYW